MAIWHCGRWAPLGHKATRDLASTSKSGTPGGLQSAWLPGRPPSVWWCRCRESGQHSHWCSPQSSPRFGSGAARSFPGCPRHRPPQSWEFQSRYFTSIRLLDGYETICISIKVLRWTESLSWVYELVASNKYQILNLLTRSSGNIVILFLDNRWGKKCITFNITTTTDFYW